VGHPRWIAGGKRIMLTRSQKDESDVVTVFAESDVPLVDADLLTTNRASASAGFDQENKYLAYSSAAAQGAEINPLWEIWGADATGKEAKRLSSGGGVSPVWIRLSAPAAPAAVAAAPTAIPRPTALPAAPAQPTAVPTAVPAAPAAAPTAVPKAPAAPAPTAVVQKPAAPSAAPPITSRPAPTQPPMKAPPLRVRLRVSFDADRDQLVLSSLTELKKTAGRVKQYAGESIIVYGPLDRSSLRGQYSSEDDRSKARAEQVAAQLAREAGLTPGTVKALPYAPVVIGAQAPNGIEVHVELK
jgi:outer membrane protein OmpA-like peptidoglycan-associated protein